MINGDTIVALSTAPGTGAIAVVRLSGTGAIQICNNIFSGKDLTKQTSHTVHFGKIKDDELDIDEVVVTLFKAPASYTKEDVVEISCHGSSYIIQQIIQLLIKQGARPAKAGEFTLRAFLNGRMDLSQAEAVADLIASDSAVAHDLAMQQMRGGFSNKIKKLREELIHFASLIELELDFSEEDVEFANREELKQLIKEIKSEIKQLQSSFELGNVLKNGVNTVIAGRPNAGKSTLLNVLLNEDRAIVSEIPGTTRDTIEEVLNIEGIRFRLIDTAGIREAEDTIEKIGVEKTLQKIKQSAIIIYLFDASSATVTEVKEDIDKLHLASMPSLIVANKTDVTDEVIIKEKFGNIASLFISAKKHSHIRELKSRLLTLVLNRKVKTGDTIISNIRHYDALTNTEKALTDAEKGLSENISKELIALDIKRALNFLGEITGEITNEDLLDNIFSKFCIGK